MGGRRLIRDIDSSALFVALSCNSISRFFSVFFSAQPKRAGGKSAG